MKSLAGAALVSALLTLPATRQASSENEKAPTIKEVMRKLHKGANSPLAKLKKELRADPPPWDQIQKTTKDFVTFGVALAKNKPPRGAKSSWAKLARRYYDTAKAMNDAAQRKDHRGTVVAYSKLAGSCITCHRAHRPRS